MSRYRVLMHFFTTCCRLQDVLPYTAYTEAAALERAQAVGGGGTQDSLAAEQQPQQSM